VRHRVSPTGILEKGGECRESPSNGGRGELAVLETLVPSNHVRAGDEAESLGAANPDKGAEVGDVEVRGAMGFRIGEVGKPPSLGGTSARP
jgi:hypothetical protein